MTMERRQFFEASLRWMLLCFFSLACVSASFSMAKAQSAPQGNTVQVDDDVLWPRAREVMFNRLPVLKDVFAADPEIDYEMRTALLPLIKELIKMPSDTQLQDRIDKAYIDIIQRRVTARAQHGTPETINLGGQCACRSIEL